MSLLKAIKAQLGLSNTPANNFTITAEADNGTLKLARGNAGSTTQDILTVDASGNVLVDGNNLNLFSAKSLATNGYQKLPSGLIIQWGVFTPVGGQQTVSLPIAFPNAFLAVSACGEGSDTYYDFIQMTRVSASQLRASVRTVTGALTAHPVNYIAIGY